jgi:acetoin utilization protein AcuC
MAVHMHHAQPGRASGFCIYNDIAITAQYLAKEYNQRVLIIDTDAHHGDGTPLCTISMMCIGIYD